jgi:acyl-CoA synthetase (AMP-forming)/AMP-acid ligase II
MQSSFDCEIRNDSAARLDAMPASADEPRDANAAQFLLQGKEPTRTALQFLNGDCTYGDLDYASRKVATFLLASGARKADRVLLVAENSSFWVASYLGILRAGLVCVPLPSGISSEDFAYIVQSVAPACAFLESRFYQKNRQVLPDIAIVTDEQIPAPASPAVFLRDLAKLFPHVPAADIPLPMVKSSDLAAVMFTSGSTAKPRGVIITHGNIIANTNSIVEYLGLTRHDSIMTVLPFHYCFGTSLLHTHLRAGGRLVIDHRFMYPEAILQRMGSSQCTAFAGVPSHFQILLRRSGIRQMSFPHLRYVQQAGGHLAPAFIREFREILPSVQMFVMYGQTEATARLAYVPPEMLDRKLGSIGKAIPGVRLSVLNEQGDDVQPGEQGEIVAEGANVAAGYWGEEEAASATFRGGKLHTGDLATVDEDGFIYITDRAKDFVKIGGKRISCRKIEEQLLEFDGLLEIAVVGISDEVSGEALKAFAVPKNRKDDSFLQRFRAFCAQRLPFEHVPKEIMLLDTLPKNSAGKIMKSALKKA